MNALRQRLSALTAFAMLAACDFAGAGNQQPVALPAPARDLPRDAAAGTQVAVFAGGCFWGVEAVFEHVRGVRDVVSGYAGGDASSAHYRTVATGRTGHAEAVRLLYDPAQVSYGQLLQVYFSVAHDPTQRDRQGPDIGPQYRSQIFTTSAEQRRVAAAYIAQLTAARAFAQPIVTRIEPLTRFYPAEARHQDYLRRHPDAPYIVRYDAPKLVHLQQLLPALYRGD